MSISFRTLRTLFSGLEGSRLEETIIRVIILFFQHDLRNRPVTVRDIEERLQTRRSEDLYDAIGCARYYFSDVFGLTIKDRDDDDDEEEGGKEYYFAVRPARPSLPRFLSRLPEAHQFIVTLIVAYIKICDDRVHEDDIWNLLREVSLMDEGFYHNTLGNMRDLVTNVYVGGHFLIYEKDRVSGDFYFRCGRASVHAQRKDMVIWLTSLLFADDIDLEIGSLDGFQIPNNCGHPGPGPPGPGPGPSGSRPGPSGSRPGPSGSRPGPSGSRPGPSGSRPGPSVSGPSSSGSGSGPSGSGPGPSGSGRPPGSEPKTFSSKTRPSGSDSPGPGPSESASPGPRPSESGLLTPDIQDSSGNIICPRCHKIKPMNFSTIVVPSLSEGMVQKESSVLTTPIAGNQIQVPGKDMDQGREPSSKIVGNQEQSAIARKNKPTSKDMYGPSTSSMPDLISPIVDHSTSKTDQPCVSSMEGPSSSTGAIRKKSPFTEFLVPSIDLYRKAQAALRINQPSGSIKRASRQISDGAASIVPCSPSASHADEVKKSTKPETSNISDKTQPEGNELAGKSVERPESKSKNIPLYTGPNQNVCTNFQANAHSVLSNQNVSSASSRIVGSTELEIRSAVISISESLKSMEPSNLEKRTTAVREQEAYKSANTKNKNPETVEPEVVRDIANLSELKIHSNVEFTSSKVPVDNASQKAQEKFCGSKEKHMETSKNKTGKRKRKQKKKKSAAHVVTVEVYEPSDNADEVEIVDQKKEVLSSETLSGTAKMPAGISVTGEANLVSETVNPVHDIGTRDIPIEIAEVEIDSSEELQYLQNHYGESASGIREGSEGLLPLNLNTDESSGYLTEEGELSTWLMETLEEELDADDFQ